jgi:hypothetical protein
MHGYEFLQSRRDRVRHIGRWAVVCLCILSTLGCSPVYRIPKRSDFFKAAPQNYEKFGPLANPPPPGLPLPEVPPPIGNGSVIPEIPSDPRDFQERPLSLEDAIRIGLSNSGVVRVLNGENVTAAGVTPYDPLIADARVRAAMAVFDPNFTSSVYSNWIDQPPQAVFGPGLSEPTLRNEAGFTSALSKPWLTGGETRISYNPPLGYLYLPNGTSGFNPLYTSNVEFLVRQPLLKAGGITVNRAPIQIAQLQRGQSALDTRQAVMASVRSVTEAYWTLYSARKASSVIDQVVPLLQQVAHIEEERMAAQRSVRADVAKAYSQLHAMRQQGVQARAAVVQNELRLRNLLGLPPCDGYILVPTSTPMEAPVVVDPKASLAIAEENRPDLLRQKLVIQQRENELLVARNFGLPQLDASGLYRWNGVGNRLDDALNQMVGTQYHDWQASMTFSMPLGRRAASAGIRAASLQLSRDRAVMQQALHAANHQITILSQQAAYTRELFAEADARFKANTVWLEGSKIRYENPPPAGDGQDWLLAATNDYLTALRSQADAVSDAQTYLAAYNTLLARISEATGTILFDYDIEMAGESVRPDKFRSAMIFQPESRAAPETLPPDLPPVAPPEGLDGLPPLPVDGVPSLPDLNAAPVVPESFPVPTASPENTLEKLPDTQVLPTDSSTPSSAKRSAAWAKVSAAPTTAPVMKPQIWGPAAIFRRASMSKAVVASSRATTAPGPVGPATTFSAAPATKTVAPHASRAKPIVFPAANPPFAAEHTARQVSALSVAEPSTSEVLPHPRLPAASGKPAGLMFPASSSSGRPLTFSVEPASVPAAPLTFPTAEPPSGQVPLKFPSAEPSASGAPLTFPPAAPENAPAP